MPTLPFQAVIFDMDDTLTVPTLDSLAPGEQNRAWAIIERHATEVMRGCGGG